MLVLAVDWFMGIGRALTNLIGNCVATVAIARWEKDIDLERAQNVLAGKPGFAHAPRKPANAHQQEF
ncbi:Aerobic C4-dicarboxylate transport protein [compost metagenome]